MASKTELILDSYNSEIIKNKLDGAIEVDECIRKTRFAICQDCDKLSKKWHRCELCNCWMPVKARLPWTKCPDGKW